MGVARELFCKVVANPTFIAVAATPPVAFVLAKLSYNSLYSAELSTAGDLVGNGVAFIVAVGVFVLVLVCGFATAAVTGMRNRPARETKVNFSAALKSSPGSPPSSTE